MVLPEKAKSEDANDVVVQNQVATRTCSFRSCLCVCPNLVANLIKKIKVNKPKDTPQPKDKEPQIVRMDSEQ